MTDQGHLETVEAAEMPQGLVKLVALLADIGREAKLPDEEFKVFENVQDRSPARGERVDTRCRCRCVADLRTGGARRPGVLQQTPSALEPSAPGLCGSMDLRANRKPMRSRR